MKPGQDRADPRQVGALPRWFPLLFGAFLGLTLLKFGNPPIMEKWVTPPKDIYEFVLGSPWPIAWAYAPLLLLAIAAVSIANRKVRIPGWLIALPAAWLAWECLASFRSVDPALSKPTLAHFFACVACFYIGLFALSQGRSLSWLLPGVGVGFVAMLAVGWQQHFGGLEQTRRYFFLYLYPQLKEVPPEYLKKLSSTRIFSTLFYPNALAGAVLLLLPVVLEFLWQARERFTQGARLFLVGSVGVGAMACLYWSGSKGGWLLMLLLGLIWLLRLSFDANLKRALVAAVLIAGLAGFFWRYSGFFQKGATSVGARFDYWAAAVRTTLDHPLFGTGPGTFALAYAKVKRPESEMSRLVHNDYLEQASDSGVLGLVFYSAFVVSALVFSTARFPLRQRDQPGTSGGVPNSTARSQAPSKRMLAALPRHVLPPNSIYFVVWLGALGWALQGLMEFSLYIPGLAWPAFTFLGLLLGRANQECV